jgi:hypothetical protein
MDNEWEPYEYEYRVLLEFRDDGSKWRAILVAGSSRSVGPEAETKDGALALLGEYLSEQFGS